MKSTPKKILSLFMSLLMLLSVTSGLTFTSFAVADVSFEYTENDDGTINITGFTAGEDSTGNLDIPSKIDGKTVTGINDYALHGYYESVTIPETVTSELSSFAFGYLDTLKSISVNKDNSVYSSADGVLFNKDKTILICCPQGRKGLFSIPDGIKQLEHNAFYWCRFLTEISIPASLDNSWTVSGYNFDSCKSLEKITVDENNEYFSSSSDGALLNKDKTELICCCPKTKTGTYSIPEGITKLDMDAFDGCNSITEIVIPSSLTAIGYDDISFAFAFRECYELKKITVDEENAYFSSSDGILYSKDKSILIGCPRDKDITAFTVSNGVKRIDDYAFSGQSNLTSIVIPDSVTEIGSEAFDLCYSLTQISLSNNITNMGFRAFYGTAYYDDESNWENACLYIDNYLLSYENENGAESVDIKDSTVLIADSAFNCAENVKKIIIPDSVKYIGNYTFCDCPSLEEITIPDSVKYIGKEAFRDCPSLAEITIPDSVISVGEYAFGSCYSLRNVTLSNSMKSIEPGTFDSCSSLERITIPNSVTSINEFAFRNCSALREIELADSITDIGEEAFFECSALEALDIPDSVMSIGENAFRYCSSLREVKLSSSVTTLSNSWFYECTNLVKVTIPKEVTEIEYHAIGYYDVYNEDIGSWYDEKIDGFTIYGYRGTAARTYAKENGFKFVNLDADSSELELAEGSLATVDNDKKIIYILGLPATYIGYLKNQFESELETDLDVNDLVTDGTTVKYGNTEYRVLVKGDIDGDGKVSVKDSRTVLKIASGVYNATEDEFAKADINSDGKVSAMEARSIIRCAARLALSIDESIDDKAEVSDDAQTPSVKFEYAFSGENELTCRFSIENNYNHLTDLLLIDIPDGLTLKDITSFKGPYTVWSELKDDNTIAMSAMEMESFDTDCTELATACFELSDDVDMDNIVFHILDGSCVDDSIPLSGELKVETYSESFEYTENDDGTIIITGFTPAANSTGTLEIPSEIDGKTVTEIKSYVLDGNYKSVVIPETIAHFMDAYTFGYLNKLQTITVDENNPYYSSADGVLFNKDKTTLLCCPRGKSGVYAIPDGIEHLDSSAFYLCGSLTEIFIPASLKSYDISLQQNFVSNCDNLESINVDDNNEYFSSADGILYSKDKSTLIACPRAKNITEFTVEDCVERIGFDAFYGQSNLTGIVIPDSVTIIEREAFEDCLNLTQISISKNLTSIGYYAFGYTGYYSDESNWENGCLYLDNYLLDFRNWDDVDSVSIKDSTVLIAAAAFYYDEKLKEVNIPDSMMYIGGSAFFNCSALEKIIIPDSVISVGSQAFSGCTSLKEVKLSESLTDIKWETFDGCSALESIHIPDSVSYIDCWAFYDCPNLKSVTLSKNIAEIEYNAFGYYGKLHESGDYFIATEIDGFTIYGYKNTVAEEYANENGFTFVDLDSSECEHKNTVVKNAVSATCTTDGYTGDTYCNDCGQTIVYGKTIPALGHKSEVVGGKSATCTESGLTDGTKCSVCGITLIAQKTIPALGHTSEVVGGTPATCTESGLTDGTKCSVCGITLIAQKTIPELGHTSEVVSGTPVTCTEPGLTDGEKCSVCGTVIKEQTEIPALGHKSEAVKGKPATCTEKGLTDGEKCSVCGAVIKEQTEIPALGHKSEAVKGKPATCTEKGLTDGEKCSVCGTVIKAQTEIPALGHKFENGVCTVCKSMDPDYKLVLNTDSKLLLDLDKKSVTSLPVSVNGTTASEFKKQFENEIDLGLDDSAPIANGTKFTFNGTEYTVIVKGDAQPDGKLTASDARTILRIAAKLDNPDDITKSAADINSDGKVTSAEARNVLRFAARLANTIEG